MKLEIKSIKKTETEKKFLEIKKKKQKNQGQPYEQVTKHRRKKIRF